MLTSQPLRTVRTYDPAIDTVAVTWDVLIKFAHERDMTLLTYLPGATPVTFVIRRISASLWEWVEQAIGDRERQTRAFRAAVVAVENLAVDGGSRINWVSSVQTNTQTAHHVAMSEVDLEQFAPADRYEIGEVAYLQSFFPKDIAPRYRLPPSSALVSDLMRVSLSVVSSPVAAAPSSAEPKAPPAAPSPAPLSPGLAGDALMAATVPATASLDASTTRPSAAT